MSIAAIRTAALVPDGCGGDDELAALSPTELERMLDREGFADGVVAATEGEGAMGAEAEAPEVEGDAPETEFDPEADVESKLGAGMASAGLSSAPVPQRTVCPSAPGSDKVAGVLEPLAAAMVNRVVQVWFFVEAAENW